jgi:hypothetical protein
MSEFQTVIDNAGREIKVELQSLGTTIKEGMSAAMAETENFATRDEERNSTLTEIKGLMEQLNALTEDVGTIKDVVQESIQMHTARQSGERPASEGLADTPSGVEQVRAGLDQAVPGGSQDQSPTEEASETIEANLSQDRPMQIEGSVVILNDAITTNVASLPETLAERQSGDETFAINADTATRESGRSAESEKKKGGGLTQAGSKAILRQVRNLAGGVLGIIAAVTGGVSIGRIFEGTIKEELDYDKLMGRIAKRTHALGDQTGELRDRFTDIGDRMVSSLHTGHKIGELMKAQVKAQQRGLKDQKKNEKFLESALTLSTLTDMSVESTTDSFSNWSQYFNFTNMELANVGRTITQIARQTGLTGKNLEEAVKSAEKFNRNLRGAGTATAEAVGQTAKIMALAKAAGIEDIMSPLMEGLTGGFGKYMDLNDKMKSQLARMAGDDGQLLLDIQVGRGLDPKNAKKIGQNFSNMVRQSIPGLDALGPLESLDISEIPSDALRGMQAMAQEVFGVGLEDLQKQIGVFQDAGKVTADFIADARKTETDAIIEIEKLRRDGLISAEQRQSMIDAAHLQATNKVNDLNQADRMKTLGAFSDLAASGGPEWFKKLGKMDKTAMTVDFADAAQQSIALLEKGKAEGTIKPAQFEKIMAEFGDPAEVQAAFTAAIESGDQGKIVELTEKLNALSETGAVTDMRGASTQDKIEHQLNVMNSQVRDFISPKLLDILDKMGASGVIAAGMAATIVAGLASLGILLTTIFPGKVAAALASPFKKILGKGTAGRVVRPGAMERLARMKGAKRSAGLSRAGGHFADAGRSLKGTAKGVLDPLTREITKGGKFVKKSFENVLGPPLRKAGQGLDTFGRAVATQGKALKIQAKRGALRASRSGVGQATGRLKSRIGSVATRAKDAADTTGRFVGRSFRNVGQGAKTGVMKIPGIKTAGKSIMTLGKQSTKVFGGLGRAGLGAARGLGATAKALSSWTIVVPLALAAVDGFIGTMRASGKAHEIFGVKQEEVTNSMRLASEGAAFWTGILDGLTFGFASKWVGPTGTWTKALAKVFDKFKILSIMMQTIIIPLKVLWGVIVGLWKFLKHSFIGLWEGIKLAVEPLVDLFEWMGGAIDQALMDIGLDSFFDSTSGLIDIVGMVAKPFEWLGKALGFVFKALGWVINILLQGLIPVFKVLWKVVSTIITAVLKPIVDVFKSLWDVGKTFIALFNGSGSLSDRFKDFGKAVMKFLLNFIMMIPKMVWNVVKGLGTLLYKGLVAGLTALFIYGPKIVSWIWDFISSGFEKVTSGAFWADVWNSLVIAAGNAIIWIENAVSGFFSGVWEGASEWVSEMWQEVVDTFGEWVNVPVDFVKDMWTKIGNFFSEIPQFFSDMWTGIKEGFVAGIMWPINLVKDMWKGIKDWFYKLYMWLVGGSIIPDLVNDIIDWFLKLPSKILKSVGDMVKKIVKFFLSLPKKVWNGLKELGKYIMGLWDGVIEWIGFDWLTNAWTKFKNFLKDPFGFIGRAWDKFKNGLSMVNPFNWDWESMWPAFLTKKYWTDMFSGWDLSLPDFLTAKYWTDMFSGWDVDFSLPDWLSPSYWNDKLGDWTGFKFKWPSILTAQWWKDKFAAWKNFEFKWPEWLTLKWWNDKLGDWTGFKFKWPEFLTVDYWKNMFTGWEISLPSFLTKKYWTDMFSGFSISLPEFMTAKYWTDKFSNFSISLPKFMTLQYWKDTFSGFSLSLPEFMTVKYWKDKFAGFSISLPSFLTAKYWKETLSGFSISLPEFMTVKYWKDTFSGFSISLPEFMTMKYWKDKFAGFSISLPEFMTGKYWTDKFSNFSISLPEFMTDKYWKDKFAGFSISLPEFMTGKYWKDKFAGFSISLPEFMTGKYWKDKFAGFSISLPEFMTDKYWKETFANFSISLPEFMTGKYWTDMFSGWGISLPSFLTSKYWSETFAKFKISLPDFMSLDYWKKALDFSSYEFVWPEWLTLEYWNKKLSDFTGIKITVPEWMTGAYWSDKWSSFTMPAMFSIDWWTNMFTKIGTAIADTFISSVDWVVNAIHIAFKSMIGGILTMLGGIKLPIPKFSMGFGDYNIPYIDVKWKQVSLFSGAAEKGAAMTKSVKKMQAQETARQGITGAKVKATDSSQAVVAYRATLGEESSQWSSDQWKKLRDLLATQAADKKALAAQVSAAGDMGGFTAGRAETALSENEASINQAWFEKNNNAWIGNIDSKLREIEGYQNAIAEAFSDGVLTPEEKKMIKSAEAKIAAKKKEYDKWMTWTPDGVKKAGSYDGIAEDTVNDMLTALGRAKTKRGVIGSRTTEGLEAGQSAIDGIRTMLKKNKSSVRVGQLTSGTMMQDKKSVPVDAAREAVLVKNLQAMVEKATTAKTTAEKGGASAGQLAILQQIIDKTKEQLAAGKEGIAERLKAADIAPLLPEPTVLEKAAKDSTTPGSIYTHDIHLEKLLTKMADTFWNFHNTQYARTHRVLEGIYETLNNLFEAGNKVLSNLPNLVGDAVTTGIAPLLNLFEAGNKVLSNLPNLVGDAVTTGIAPLLPEPSALEKAAKDSTTPGSIYTHDIHLEKLFADVSSSFWEFHTTQYARTHRVLEGIYESLKGIFESSKAIVFALANLPFGLGEAVKEEKAMNLDTMTYDPPKLTQVQDKIKLKLEEMGVGPKAKAAKQKAIENSPAAKRVAEQLKTMGVEPTKQKAIEESPVSTGIAEQLYGMNAEDLHKAISTFQSMGLGDNIDAKEIAEQLYGMNAEDLHKAISTFQSMGLGDNIDAKEIAERNYGMNAEDLYKAISTFQSNNSEPIKYNLESIQSGLDSLPMGLGDNIDAKEIAAMLDNLPHGLDKAFERIEPKKEDTASDPKFGHASKGGQAIGATSLDNLPHGLNKAFERVEPKKEETVTDSKFGHAFKGGQTVGASSSSLPVGDAVDSVMTSPYGEVSLPDNSTAETRTMSAEESAEARLQRHKTETQPQQVSVYSATTEELQNIGLDQVTQLVAIKDGINKLVGLLTSRGGSESVSSDNNSKTGSTGTRHTGNHSTLEWGEAPFSSGNDAQMQSVVSQVGVA